MTAKTETEFKANLADLTKIPAKEFERHFRDWMERDEVARALQAKMRTDLIQNFNKTSLGKQILAQTTMTTGGGVGGTQRLTLSPLILALNTLVAEFLYAQNCHFSLSVFCTEVPFRNTLPDFESTGYFRFTEMEILDIFQAISGVTKCELFFKKEIAKNYATNASVSLLLLILKALLEEQSKITFPAAQLLGQLSTNVKEDNDGEETEMNMSPQKECVSEKATRHDVKTKFYNTNFRHLNKYLIILSRKVSEMAQHFENMQYQRPIPRPRLLKTMRLRKYENLNRSIERITENLRQMSHAKRKSKRLGAIVGAIDALALQFAKCSAKFENVFTQRLVSNTCAEKQTETERHPERSYADWVNEMRHSANGQKFLDRIEVSLRKALNKQKEQLRNETEMKLRHQKELLKIHYKQKLIEHLSNHASSDISGESRKFNRNFGKPLKHFETKHCELLSKVRKTDIVACQLPCKEVHTERVVEVIHEKESEEESSKPRTDACLKLPPTVLPTPEVNNSLTKDTVNKHRQLQSLVNNITEQDRNLDHIVYDAKLRMQELEHESNQLEQSFHDYLERQRRQKEKSTHEVTFNQWQNFNLKRLRIRERYGKKMQYCKTNDIRPSDEELHMCSQKVKERSRSNNSQISAAQSTQSTTMNSILSRYHNNSEQFEFKNAISDAKEKFFEGERKFKEQVAEKLLTSTASILGNIKESTEEPNLHGNLKNSDFYVGKKQLFVVSEIDAVNTQHALSSIHSEMYIHDQKLDDNEIDLRITSTDTSNTETSIFSIVVGDDSEDKLPLVDGKNLGNTNTGRLELKKQHAYPICISAGNKERNVAAKKTPTTATSSIVLHQSMVKMQQLFAQKQVGKYCVDVEKYDENADSLERFSDIANIDFKIHDTNNNKDNIEPNQTNEHRYIIDAMAAETSLTTTTDSIRAKTEHLQLEDEKETGLSHVATTNETIATAATKTTVAASFGIFEVTTTLGATSGNSSCSSNRDESKIDMAVAIQDDDSDIEDEKAVVERMLPLETDGVVDKVNLNFTPIDESNSSDSSNELRLSTGGEEIKDGADGSNFWQ